MDTSYRTGKNLRGRTSSQTLIGGKGKIFLFNALIISLCCVAGCGMIDLKSHWRNRDVLIDGKNTEWRNSLALLDDKETSVGILNDSNFIYIALVSSNRSLRSQVMRHGITFWFDNEGGKDEKFGIHYPLGFGGFRPPQDGDLGGEDQASAAGRSETSNELEIEGPGKDDHHQMTFAESGGIEAKFRTSNDILVYELKVPLSDNGSHPFVIGTKAGTLIGIGAETSTASSAARRSESVGEGGGGERGGGMGEGGGGGYGGGRGRRGGGRGGGRSPSGDQGEPFKMWAKVQLAEQDTSAH